MSENAGKQYVQYASLEACTCLEYLRKDIQEARVIAARGVWVTGRQRWKNN